MKRHTKKSASKKATGLRRKAQTAGKLLRNGDFERLTTAAARALEDNAPQPLKHLNLGYRLRNMRLLTGLSRTHAHSPGAAPFAPLAVSPLPSTYPVLSPAQPLPLAAVILDEFSLSAFSAVMPTVQITPDNWLEVFQHNKPAWLFVESAWRGNGGTWAKRLSTPGHVDPELQAVTDFCRNEGIPTVFWNKEDPVHFADFISTAGCFDTIFTTDDETIDAYRAQTNAKHVAVLPFAAQPAIHNPVRNPQPKDPLNRPGKQFQAGDIAFAGTYFRDKYPERRAQMDLLLGAATSLANTHGLRLSIFSRYGNADKRYRFPTAFRPFVVGSLDYTRMLSALKQHKVFLNVNSVTTSRQMCARRLFEFPAAGALVVTTPSPATRTFFDEDMVPEVQIPEEAKEVLLALATNAPLRDRMLHRAQRHIWRAHTYQHRVETILQAIGLSPAAAEQWWTAIPRITCLCPTNRPAQLRHVIEQLGQQEEVALEVIVLAHGWKLDADAQADVFAEAEARGFQVVEEGGFEGFGSVNADPGAGDNPELSTNTELSTNPEPSPSAEPASNAAHTNRTIRIVHCDADLQLGEILNLGVDQARFPIIAKIDDDDFYLPWYLFDQARALLFSGADLVGKRANYAYLAEKDMLVLRHPEAEHCYADFLAGPTLMGWTKTFQEFPFEARTTGEDSAFLRALTAAGKRIYSTDRFNFIQVRGKKPQSDSHTWDISDWHFLAHGQLEVQGLASGQVRC